MPHIPVKQSTIIDLNSAKTQVMQFIPGNRQMTDSKWSDEVFKRTLLRSSNTDETSYYNDGYVFDNTSRTYIDMCA